MLISCARIVAARVATVLNSFTAQDAGLPVAELAARTGLPRSTVHRLSRQLVDVGLPQHEGSRLSLGLKFFELGQLAPQQRTLAKRVRPFLTGLRDSTRHTANLAVLDGREIVFLDRVLGPQSPPMSFRSSGRHIAYPTALGKAILAHLPASRVDAVCRHGLDPVTPFTITTREELEEQLHEVRSTGLAYDRGETQLGVQCAASPIFDANGMVLAAISVTGLSGHAALARGAQAVHAMALELTKTLHGRVTIVEHIRG